MRLPLFWIDAFAARPFAGNPAGVVPLERWLPTEIMQQIAFENRFSETAFFVPADPSDPKQPRYHLRWFTPAVEVDLCGHATLATGHVVLRELGSAAEHVTFESRSGPLVVARRGEQLELDFPATPARPENDPALRVTLASALGVEPSWLGRSRSDVLVVLSDASLVRSLAPNLTALAAADARGVIVTAPGDGSCDFVSRFFAPRVGVPEDPVTGSAHCALAPYWAERLGRSRLHARQLSPRGGELWCEVVAPQPGQPHSGRVKIAGYATRYLRGEIEIPAAGGASV